MSKRRFSPPSTPLLVARQSLSELPYGGMLDNVITEPKKGEIVGDRFVPSPSAGAVTPKRVKYGPDDRDILNPEAYGSRK